MPSQRTIVALAIAATFVIAGCSSSGGEPGTSPALVGQSPASAGAGGVTVGTATAPSLGTYLTGADGKTLYTFVGDGPNDSTCTGECATAWPPFTVAAGGQPTPGAGVTGKLGTLTRADGTTQVSYDGLPLYYWQGDAKPGDTTGDGVSGFSIAKVGGAAPVPNTSGKGSY